ncbi:MAG: endonuclease III [Candidatus Diapherotrites archaeon]
MKNKSQIKKIVLLLRKEVGGHEAIVHYSDPFRVLISTVLSQRTRDANTDKASKNLFAKFNSPKKLARAGLMEIQKLIRPSGFYKVKAKRIKAISKQLTENFNGRVPEKIEGLLSLEGVGRKTANCVLVYAFNIPAIPVDTHVHRISNRIGLVKAKTPEQTEKALVKVIPRNYWIELNDLMVKFGQRICLPRNPKCSICHLKIFCDYYFLVMKKNESKA